MSEETFPVANVGGREVPFDPEQLRRIQQHPCFSEKACHSFGRMHLAVAPKCNIQCKYCVRDFDCVNESRPGVTSQVLRPQEALDRVDQVIEKYHYIKVVAVAGPGEPLANEETFETLRLVGQKYPNLILCISAPMVCSCRTRSKSWIPWVSAISR
jgi:nitrogen fixation protein NifB